MTASTVTPMQPLRTESASTRSAIIVAPEGTP
jgi:hypothetical protein